MTRTGYRLVAAAVALSCAHHIDHVLRGGEATGWPLTSSINAFTYSLAVYPVIVIMAFLSRRGRAGPFPWVLLSAGGAVFVLAVHLGPAAGDAVADIPDGYTSPVAGILAVAALVALIALLALTAVYEARLAGAGVPLAFETCELGAQVGDEPREPLGVVVQRVDVPARQLDVAGLAAIAGPDLDQSVGEVGDLDSGQPVEAQDALAATRHRG